MINGRIFAVSVMVMLVLLVATLSSLASGDDVERPIVAAERPPEVRPNQRPVAAVDGGGGAPAAQELGDHAPLMIRWSNWRPEFGPAYVYAREQDLGGLLSLDAPVYKMLMVTSYDEAQRLVAQADQLKAAGVTTIGLNTENGAGMTPGNEMQTLASADPQANVVARVAGLAAQHGFELVWGPVRNMVDQVSDDAVRAMIAAGMTGLAIQEQKFIENQPAEARLQAVARTRERYLRLAEEQGVTDFTFHVQIMHERCPNLPNCVAFVAGLEAMPVDSVAIWSNGPIPVDFVSAIRSQDDRALLSSRQ